MEKKILFIISFLFIVFTANAQSKIPVVNEIMTLIEAKETAQNVTRVFIEQCKKNKKNVPENIWARISAEVDYTTFLKSASSLYENNFTLTELQKMSACLKKGDMDGYNKLAQRIEKPLYDIGNNFGKSLAASVQNKLKAYGY